MFNDIAPRYDTLNHLLSLGLDKRWRRATVRRAAAACPTAVLDLAAGTGDMTLALLKRYVPQHICCADLSPEMLGRGKEKISRRLAKRFWKKRLAQGTCPPTTDFVECTAEALPFADGSFDVVMIGFGVRNFADIPQSMREIARVLKPGGRLVVLEFSMPRRGFFALLYRLYLRLYLPLVGGLISGSFKAYRYLPSSMAQYAAESPLLPAITAAGMVVVEQRPLSGGTVMLTVGGRS